MVWQLVVIIPKAGPLKACGRYPDGKCPDGGHLVARALWASCIFHELGGRVRFALQHNR